jgi:hypothetical protein
VISQPIILAPRRSWILLHSLAAKKRAERMMLGAITMGLELTHRVGEALRPGGAGLPRKMADPCLAEGVQSEIG